MEQNNVNTVEETVVEESTVSTPPAGCLLYTSDAADE